MENQNPAPQSTTNTDQSKSNKKGFTYLVVTLLIILVLVLGGLSAFLYLEWNKSSKNNNNSQPTPTPTSTSELKKYTDDGIHIEFLYSEDLTVEPGTAVDTCAALPVETPCTNIERDITISDNFGNSLVISRKGNDFIDCVGIYKLADVKNDSKTSFKISNSSTVYRYNNKYVEVNENDGTNLTGDGMVCFDGLLQINATRAVIVVKDESKLKVFDDLIKSIKYITVGG